MLMPCFWCNIVIILNDQENDAITPCLIAMFRSLNYICYRRVRTRTDDTNKQKGLYPGSICSLQVFMGM